MAQYPGPSGFRGQFNPLQQQQQQQQQMMNQMAGPIPQQQIQQQQQQMIPPMGMQIPQQQQQLQQQQMQMGQQQQQQMQMGQQQQQQMQMGQQTLPAAAANPSLIAPNPMLAIAQPNPQKEINIVALARLGQETVQDITSRFQEIYQTLRNIQTAGNRDSSSEKKVQEYFRTIRLLFKRVRILYEKCNDANPGMEYTQAESLIPYADSQEHRPDPCQSEEYRKALQENQELIETVKLKNRQLREIIDRTRIIIWEINTMLNMRRT